MELGATLCTPRDPACLVCPLTSLCPTRQAGLQHRIPAPKKKTQYEERVEAAVVVRRADHAILLRQCQPGERWAGLWDFPRVAIPENSTPESLADAVGALTGVSIRIGDEFAAIKHGVTRYRITLRCYHARPRARPAATTPPTQRWAQVAELAELPLSTTGRKISCLLS